MLQTVNDKTMLEPKAYDFLKNAAMIYLPALGTLYLTLSGIWGLPAGQEVVGSIVAVDTFLGVVLKISSNNFDASGAGVDGNVVVIPQEDGTKTVSLDVNGDPADVLSQKAGDTITFKVPEEAAQALQGNPPTDP